MLIRSTGLALHGYVDIHLHGIALGDICNKGLKEHLLALSGAGRQNWVSFRPVSGCCLSEAANQEGRGALLCRRACLHGD